MSTVLAIGPGGWGRGKTEKEAIRIARKHLPGPPIGPKKITDAGFLIVRTSDPRAYVDGLGRIMADADALVVTMKEADDRKVTW